MKEELIRLKLPMPISINIAYSGKVKRFKSNKYKDWIKKAKIELNKQTSYTISGDSWLKVYYTFNFSLYTQKKKKRIKDVANFEKVLSDFLADNIKGFEDHKIKEMVLIKNNSTENTVNILIKEINE